MKIKLDFNLNNQFNPLEKILVRFVINGITDINEITPCLPLFSDLVIADGIKHLVNQQILIVNSEIGTITLSEPLRALISKCQENVFDLTITAEIQSIFENSGLQLSNNQDCQALKKAILYELFPEVYLDIYIKTIDFVLYADKGDLNE